MKGIIYVCIVCLFMIAAGCQKDIPEPETRISVQPISFNMKSSDIPVFNVESNSNDPFYVGYEVVGRNVLIECIVQGITFRESADNMKGKIILYVDGKKKEEINSAAFIVRALPPGKHLLKLEVVKENDPSVIMKKEFSVQIR